MTNTVGLFLGDQDGSPTRLQAGDRMIAETKEEGVLVSIARTNDTGTYNLKFFKDNKYLISVLVPTGDHVNLAVFIAAVTGLRLTQEPSNHEHISYYRLSAR